MPFLLLIMFCRFTVVRRCLASEGHTTVEYNQMWNRHGGDNEYVRLVRNERGGMEETGRIWIDRSRKRCRIRASVTGCSSRSTESSQQGSGRVEFVGGQQFFWYHNRRSFWIGPGSWESDRSPVRQKDAYLSFINGTSNNNQPGNYRTLKCCNWSRTGAARPSTLHSSSSEQHNRTTCSICWIGSITAKVS